MEIIAHRGASFEAPENTLRAIELAWEQNADGVEVDVQLTRNEKIVVIHDQSLKRLAGREDDVDALNLNQLRRLDVGKWKGPKWKGVRIPELAEVLTRLPRNKKLFVEVKTGPEILPMLVKTVRDISFPARHLIFIGFGFRTMVALKSKLPRHPVLWIFEGKKEKESRATLRNLIPKVRRAGLDGLDLSGRLPMSPALIKEVHKAGLKLYVWTVDDPVRAIELQKMGVDGIATNRPGWLRQQLNLNALP